MSLDTNSIQQVDYWIILGSKYEIGYISNEKTKHYNWVPSAQIISLLVLI